MNALSLLTIGRHEGATLIELYRSCAERLPFKVTIRTTAADSTDEQYFTGSGETAIEAVEAAVKAFNESK